MIIDDLLPQIVVLMPLRTRPYPPGGTWQCPPAEEKNHQRRTKDGQRQWAWQRKVVVISGFLSDKETTCHKENL